MGELQEEARRLLVGITPGPWEFDGRVQVHTDEVNVASITDGGRKADGSDQADGRFIAAAPRLVAGLLAALDDRDAALSEAEAEQRRLREENERLLRAVGLLSKQDHLWFGGPVLAEMTDLTPEERSLVSDVLDRGRRAALGSVSAVPTDDEPATLEPEHWCDCPADACRGIGPDPGGCGYCWAKDSDEPCPNSGLYNDERDDATTLQDLHELLGLTPDDLLAKGFRIVPAVPLSVEEASDEH